MRVLYWMRGQPMLLLSLKQLLPGRILRVFGQKKRGRKAQFLVGNYGVCWHGGKPDQTRISYIRELSLPMERRIPDHWNPFEVMIVFQMFGQISDARWVGGGFSTISTYERYETSWHEVSFVALLMWEGLVKKESGLWRAAPCQTTRTVYAWRWSDPRPQLNRRM